MKLRWDNHSINPIINYITAVKHTSRPACENRTRSCKIEDINRLLDEKKAVIVYVVKHMSPLQFRQDGTFKIVQFTDIHWQNDDPPIGAASS